MTDGFGGEYTYRDELIWQIRSLHEFMTAEGDAELFIDGNLSGQDLQDLYEEMLVALQRFFERRTRRRTTPPEQTEAEPSPVKWNAWVSRSSKEHITERSG